MERTGRLSSNTLELEVQHRQGPTPKNTLQNRKIILNKILLPQILLFLVQKKKEVLNQKKLTQSEKLIQ